MMDHSLRAAQIEIYCVNTSSGGSVLRCTPLLSETHGISRPHVELGLGMICIRICIEPLPEHSRDHPVHATRHECQERPPRAVHQTGSVSIEAKQDSVLRSSTEPPFVQIMPSAWEAQGPRQATMKTPYRYAMSCLERARAFILIRDISGLLRFCDVCSRVRDDLQYGGLLLAAPARRLMCRLPSCGQFACPVCCGPLFANT